VLTFISEDLPPSRVGAPDLQVMCLSWALDIEWLAVVLGLNGQWLLVEPPGLGVSSISSLDDHVSVVDKIKVSSWWQLGDDVEWSFDIEAEFFIEFSFSWFSLPFIGIDDIPLLVDSTMLVSCFNISIFSINISLDL
jgi:hypothetical protein